MSRAVTVRLIVPNAVRERTEHRYSRATAQDSVSIRDRRLPAKIAAKRLEPASQGPTQRTSYYQPARVKPCLAPLYWEWKRFASAPSTNRTAKLRSAGMRSPGCKSSSRAPPLRKAFRQRGANILFPLAIPNNGYLHQHGRTRRPPSAQHTIHIDRRGASGYFDDSRRHGKIVAYNPIPEARVAPPVEWQRF